MRKGFTLIELLAVIVVIALVMVMAVPLILGVIEKTKMGAIESDAKLVLNAIEKKMAIDQAFIYTDIDETNIDEKLGIKPMNYSKVKIEEENGKPKILIEGKNKYNGYTAYGTSSNITVINSDDYDTTPPVIELEGENPLEIELGSDYIEPGATARDEKDGDVSVTITGTVNKNMVGPYIITYKAKDNNGNEVTITRTVNVVVPNYAGPGYKASKGVNGPVLASGMVPIKWNDSAWVDTTTGDSDWYNYTTGDKKWANARTGDCVNPSSPSTCSMWVWIPRYIYKISTGWHTNQAGTIDVQFSMGTDDTRGGTVTLDTGITSNASDNKWTNHPAFKFGNTSELTGIWVAKFEARGNSSAIDSKPNATSLTSLSVSDIFTATRGMETNGRYGWGTSGDGIDTHLTKNIEWGAVAYLSQSSYGKNAKLVLNNNSGSNNTGCAANSSSEGSYNGCRNAYNTSNGQLASTTGTIYGVYDMSGGASEYTAAYVNNSYADDNGASLYSALDKYKDVYTFGNPDITQLNYLLAINKKGDAIYETSSTTDIGNSSWHGEASNFPAGGNSWFIRGGSYDSVANTGPFAVGVRNGTIYSNYFGFRMVLLVENGL